MKLLIQSNDAQNAISLDLTNYLDVQQGKGMDPQDPNFREALISHSLLKEGGVLALENLKAKELVFPVQLFAANASGLATLIQQINQVFASPGATVSWQDDGLSQPTVFDMITGQFDIAYDYRKAQKFWTAGKLRLFCQPFGRTASPRPYAAASGVGPLLMISPYASGGANILGASTQAGVAGFGGGQQPSGGVFYQGNPSLAGDAPAQLQISYVGPAPNGATQAGQVPYVAVSLLPDATYRPLVTAPQVTRSLGRVVNASGAVASQYLSLTGANTDVYSFTALPSQTPTLLDSGNQRLFAIARASGGAAALQLQANEVAPFSSAASVYPGDWGLYDLGVFALRASQVAQQPVTVAVGPPPAGGALDVTAFVTLPDATTWFLNPAGIQPSQYGLPGPAQYVASQSWITGASSPLGVAVDANFVYWTNLTANTIGRANLDGTSPSQSWITGASSPYGVAVDANFVYWTNLTANTIGRANLGGTSPSQSWITGANGPYGVAVDANFVYWANNGANTIGRANLGGTSPSQSWITGASTPRHLAVDANFVYWANNGANTIGRANLGGTSPSQSWITGANGPAGVAVDANFVYWANSGANTIGRANLGGTFPAQNWLTGASGPYGLAVDGNTVAYWANRSNNSIGRAVRQQTTVFAPYTNTLLLDDTLSDQFVYQGGSQSFAPSPSLMVAQSARVTQYSRGLVPRPNPYNGLPILAILGVGQNSTPSTAGSFGQPGASWSNQQNQQAMAQVNVVERVRYVFS